MILFHNILSPLLFVHNFFSSVFSWFINSLGGFYCITLSVRRLRCGGKQQCFHFPNWNFVPGYSVEQQENHHRPWFYSSFDFWCSFYSLRGKLTPKINLLFTTLHLPPSTTLRPNPQNIIHYELCKKFISLLEASLQLMSGACCFGLFISSFVMITC